MTIAKEQSKSQHGFCSNCGESLVRCVPKGDTHERSMCQYCGYISYENPKILVACIATWNDKMLMIRRGTPPGKGLWFLPSGFMECGETPEQAVARELYEETRAEINMDSLKLYILGSIPSISEIYLVYRGELKSPDFQLTPEAMDVRFVDIEEEIPLDKVAFPEVADSLYSFRLEHRTKNYGVYSSHYMGGEHIIKRIHS